MDLYIILKRYSCFRATTRECDMGYCFSKPVDFNGEVCLHHFHLHRVVGKGNFSKVQVIEHRLSKKLYALKFIDKAQCIRQKAIDRVLQERQLLEKIDHTFIVIMHYAFQDDKYFFFVLDFMPGGDLGFHLKSSRLIPENTVRFWVAELSSALDYLHGLKIMHRDIKPDNILLDSIGHVHITDFNVAAYYSDHRLHSTVAGSTPYMAPQIFEKKGYSWQVDWWSLGVTAYELLFHERPFHGFTIDSMTQSILMDTLTFPEQTLAVSHDSISALRGFIDRDPHTRLGCCSNSRGLEAIRRHPWFAGIDWEALDRKDCQPPFVPDTKQLNFDLVSSELDKFLCAETPLRHSNRIANLDLDKLKPELREIEERFAVYDFSKYRNVTDTVQSSQ